MFTPLRHAMAFVSIASLPLALAACGGGSSYGGGGGGGGGGSYTVGGTVTGLTGTGMVLRDNGGDDHAVASNGAFTFATKVANGSAYAVSVYAQPSGPSQTCTVMGGSGTMGSANVTSVSVDCSTNYSAGTLTGTFRSAVYAAAGDVGITVSLALDGAGNSTSSNVVGNGLGQVGTGTGGPATYTVAAGGALNFMGGTPTVTTTGGVSSDGRTFILAPTLTGGSAAGQDPSLSVAIKTGQSNFTNASLMGSYLLAIYSNRGDSSALVTLTADGAGGYSGTAQANDSGVITTNSPVSGSYTVASDGTLNITQNGGGPPLTGNVSADGKTLLLAVMTSMQNPALVVGIKQGQTGFNNASLKGKYLVAVYSSSGTDDQLIVLNFDGAGHVSGQGIDNDGAAITTFPVTGGTYTVSSGGALTVDPGPGTTLQTGGISADGNTLILTELTAGDLPSIDVGVRQ